MMLASDFSGMVPFLLGVPLVIAALAFLSCYGSALGHWLGPVLAIPSLLIGLLLTVMLMQESPGAIPIFWIVFPAPLVLGIASLALWSVKRATRVAFMTTAVVVLLVAVVLGLAGVHRIHHQALQQIEATERAKLMQMDAAYQAKLYAAVAADPDNADKIRAQLKPEGDAVEAQRRIVHQAQDDLRW